MSLINKAIISSPWNWVIITAMVISASILFCVIRKSLPTKE